MAGSFPHAFSQPLRGQPIEIALPREALWDLIVGEVALVEREVKVALIGSATGIPDRLRQFSKLRDHFLRRLDIKLVGVKPESIGIVDRLAGLQAEHHVVWPGVLFLQIMTVVGPDQRDPQLLVNLNQTTIGDALVLQTIRLDLQVVVILAKDLPVLTGRLDRALHILLADQVGDLATQTAGECDETLMMLLKQFFVHPRLVIEPFQIGLAHQLDQVLVSSTARGQEDEMIIVIMREVPLSGQPASWRQVRFAAEDGLDSPGLSLLIKLDRTEHIAVVRDGDRRHAEFFDLPDQRRNLIRAVQQAVLRMQVKVDELGRHYGEPQRGIVIGP